MTIVYSAATAHQRGRADLIEGFKRTDLWIGFALRDIRFRFRRSVLGPLWITLSTAMTIAALALVYSSIFPQTLAQTIPYLAVGLVIWNFISTAVIEGCDAFIWPERWIKNVPTPLCVHWLRTIARNLLTAGFNAIIIALVLAIYPPELHASNWSALIGMFLLVLNIAWATLVLGVVCARFRDLSPIVASLMQVIFFLTPIFWSTSMANGRAAFVSLNPFFHLIEVVRAPLLGSQASALSWTITACMPVLGFAVAAACYRFAHPRLPFWI